MDITITISENVEHIVRAKAEENGKDVEHFVEEFVEKSFTNGQNQISSESEERPFMRMRGMFSSGKTDTSERMQELLLEENFDPAEGFSIR